MKFRRRIKGALLVLVYLAAITVVWVATFHAEIPVLNPKGMIGIKQRDLIILATALMLIVVLPVCFMTLYFGWKYKAGNTKAKYEPNWSHSHVAEAIWWGFPCVIIIVLSVVCWKSSHELDPFKPIASSKKPLHIQVVALQWKWLFIYPEQNIATVNFVQFPEKTPLAFEITSDAPMNSFWIPQLGSQIYAMSGMRSKLHLIADEPGSFRGLSANISGKGFSGMTFTAKASSEDEFSAWVKTTQQSEQSLGLEEYRQLVEPSEYNPVETYQLKKTDLFDWVVMQYMTPEESK